MCRCGRAGCASRRGWAGKELARHRGQTFWHLLLRGNGYVGCLCGVALLPPHRHALIVTLFARHRAWPCTTHDWPRLASRAASHEQHGSVPCGGVGWTGGAAWHGRCVCTGNRPAAGQQRSLQPTRQPVRSRTCSGVGTLHSTAWRHACAARTRGSSSSMYVRHNVPHSGGRISPIGHWDDGNIGSCSPDQAVVLSGHQLFRRLAGTTEIRRHAREPGLEGATCRHTRAGQRQQTPHAQPGITAKMG